MLVHVFLWDTILKGEWLVLRVCAFLNRMAFIQLAPEKHSTAFPPEHPLPQNLIHTQDYESSLYSPM